MIRSFLQNLYAPLSIIAVILVLFLGGCAIVAIFEGIEALIYLAGRIAGV